MRKFNLSRSIDHWQRRYSDLKSLSSRLFNVSKTVKPFTQATDGVRISSRVKKKHPALILLLTIFFLTSIVGYRFYIQPQLAVGTVSPVEIEAPYDGHFEDYKTTAQKRRDVRTGTVPILKSDPNRTEQSNQSLAQLLKQLEQLRQGAEPFPFVDVNILSQSVQHYLRSSQEHEWQAVLASVDSKSQSNSFFYQAAVELQQYRQQVSETEFKYLIDKITRTRQDYAAAKAKAVAAKLPLENEEKIALLRLNDDTWHKTKTGLDQALARILTQGIPPGLPHNMIEETAKMQLQSTVPKGTEAIATKLLVSTIRPNLTQDTEETKRRAETAALAIEPVIVTVKKGDVIVEGGERITQADFVLLDAFDLSRRGINWAGLGLTSVLVTGAISIFWLVNLRHYSLRSSDLILLSLLSLSAPLLATISIKYTPLPAIGLLVGSFYSPALAATQVSLLTGLVAFSTQGAGGDYLLAGAVGGLVAALVAGRLRSREELALLGAAVGIVQGSVYLVINLIISATAGTIWYAVLPEAIVYGILGLAWSIVAQGVSPYLERLFDLVTPIRLAELANPNRPLLKRLATEAPGTFQHTMMVASLAEAAARELHCNVELVRTGTLYHDIGKLHDPLGFIENQMGGPNKHDEINDPWLSAKIIKKHVIEGLVMARRYGLPKAIQNFIPEHQGNLAISYFYFKAKQQVEQEGGTLEADTAFRYDGPIPQSRETGIVMLADSSEAALRSLKEATPKEALAMISKIFKARWRENQLIDSGIKYEELPKIADIFVRVWQQSNHKRISYPKAALEPQRASN